MPRERACKEEEKSGAARRGRGWGRMGWRLEIRREER